jgi:hypothetical protein
MVNLSDLYDQLNADLFDRRLPKYRVIFSSRFPPTGYEGHYSGTCDTKRRLIRLRRGMNVEQLRRVLIHEMCHIRHSYHGRRWQACMMFVAASGEPWAATEASQYRESGVTWNNLIATTLIDALRDRAMPPRISFREVRRMAAKIMWISYTDTKRKLPWLKGAWAKACREADLEVERRLKHGELLRA